MNKKLNKITKGLLMEQSTYNPVTNGDINSGSWNPCTNGQFMLGYGSAQYSAPCYWGGTINSSSQPMWSLPPFIGGVCDVTSSNQVCLVYDTFSSSFLTADPNSTLSSTACNTGCAWGTTFGNGDGLFFEGYNCNSNSGICEVADDGTAQYDTQAICDQNCSGVSTGTLGCCVPYSVGYNSTNVGCEDINNPGDVAFADCSYTQCCTYTQGCLDNRQTGGGAPLVTANNAWTSGVNGAPGGVCATYDSVLRFDYDDTVTPYTIPSFPYGFPTPSNLTLASFNGCTYPTPNSTGSFSGCMDPVAGNYSATYEADCGDPVTGVPVLATDPYFTLSGTYGETWCCTYQIGCMDGGNTNDGNGAYSPSWRPNWFPAAQPACSFDATATQHDEMMCTYNSCAGCTDPIAQNYSAGATVDNGTCSYVAGCMDPTANNTNTTAVADCTGALVIDGAEYATYNGTAYASWPSFSTTAGGTIVGPGQTTGCPNSALDCTYTYYGCTDPNASNYDSGANTDDGSCTYLACGNPGATDYFWLANTSTQYTPPNTYAGVDCDGAAPFDNEGCCDMPFYGCTDPTASNYNSTQGAQPCDGTNDPNQPCEEDANGNLQSGPNCCCCLVTGCADNTTIWDGACNHPTAGADNYDQWACDPDPAQCVYNGCTDPAAANYCPTANTDDGSCQFEGCVDPSAENYDASASGCIGDGGVINQNNDGSVPNGCCQYSMGCTDPTVGDPNLDYPCNQTSNVPGTFLVYGASGPNMGYPVYVAPTDGGATDNFCCPFTYGCKDNVASNYDATASNPCNSSGTPYDQGYDPALDNDCCTYTFGCQAADDGDSTNGGPHTYDNYQGSNVTYPCNTGMGNNESLMPTSSWGTLPGQAGYDATDDNDCCYIQGCTDDTATNYIPWATSSGACTYPNYGCATEFGDNGFPNTNYSANNLGCEGTTPYWTWDINGTVTDGPGMEDIGNDDCCNEAIPNTVSFACLGDYAIGDDLNTQPAGGWGGCAEITGDATLILGLQIMELTYNIPTNNPSPNGLTYEGTYLFQGNNFDAATVSAVCTASCNPGGQHDCEDVPVIGCSFCQPDSLGDVCNSTTNHGQAIQWGWDPQMSNQGPYLAFNTLDECNNSPDCGIERKGCMDPDYCEYWTQAIQITTGVYENGTGGNITIPEDSMIGLLPVSAAMGGCATPIVPGCTNPSSPVYNPAAIENCPNPYVDQNTGAPSSDPQHQASLTATGFGANPQISIVSPGGGSDVDWMNSSQFIVSDAIPPTWNGPGDWGCSFYCEDTANFTGDPLAVMQNGGACCVCPCPANGTPCTNPCTLESDPNNWDASFIYHNPDDLQNYTGCSACENASECGGQPGQYCLDDGSNNWQGAFDAARSAANWPAAGSGVPACNYDAAAPPAAPDPSLCAYDCAGCDDPNALNGPPNSYGCDNGDPQDNPTPVYGPQGYALPLVSDNDCCCYIEGCTNDTVGDNPSWNQGSGQWDLCANGSTCGTPAAGCCGAGNGYAMINFNPIACMDDGSCTTDQGFDCVDYGSSNICEPYVGSGMGPFTSMNQCINSGCGDGRYECVPSGGGGLPTVPSKGTQTIAEQPLAGFETAQGDVQAYDEPSVGLEKDPKQDGGGVSVAGADCCLPDPLGTYTSMVDCKENSPCYDCSDFGDIRFHCEEDVEPSDDPNNDSGDRCVQTTFGDCVSNNWTCYTSMLQCRRSGCEKIRETWYCPRNLPGEIEPDREITIGEQFPQQIGQGMSTGLSIQGGYTGCRQGGYTGFNTRDECHDNTTCWVSSTNDHNWNSCFVGETMVKMGDDTEKRIDEIKEGDEVLNDLGTTSIVKQHIIHEEGPYQIYGFNGGEGFVTKDHPLKVQTKEGEEVWKAIDPSWIAPVTHEVDTLTLEVGDMLVVGKEEKLVEVKSIEETGTASSTYNLTLDNVHTYYANDYVAHNAFFRSNNTLNEIEDVVIGQWLDDDPDKGCPCPPYGITFSPACCKTPPPPPSPTGNCPPNKYRCTIGYTWNPGGSPPAGGCGGMPPEPDCGCVTGGNSCIQCTEDPNNPGFCKHEACSSGGGNQPCNGNPNQFSYMGQPCYLWCG